MIAIGIRWAKFRHHAGGVLDLEGVSADAGPAGAAADERWTL